MCCCGRWLGGVGAIMTLHHVRPPRRGRFQPNRLLEVTPAFFESVIRRLRRSGVDLVSLDEMHRRMTERRFPKRFVCITFDDGYRDNLEFAYPILKKYEVPFAIYVATGFTDRVGEMWWLALEAVIAKNELHRASASTARTAGSIAARRGEARGLSSIIYWWLRRLKTEDELRQVVRELAARYHVDIQQYLRRAVHDLAGAGRACRRSAGDDRRAHGQSRRCWRRCPSRRCAPNWRTAAP